MRVLAIAHNGVLSENQNRWRQLAVRHPVSLSVLIPPRWQEAQGDVMAEVTHHDLYRILIRKPVLAQRYYTHVYPRLGQLIREAHPDIIDVFEEPWSLLALQAWVATRWTKPRPALVLETEQNLRKTFPPPFQQIWRFAIRKADAVVARSSGAAKIARAKGARLVKIIPHGVDNQLFSPVPDAQAPAASDPLRILFVGRAELAEKGLEILLGAVSRLRLATEVHVAGPIRSGMRSKYAANIPGGVEWHGPVDHTALPDLYRAAHVVVVPSMSTPSWKEQFGRVLIEAMACGTPVIASRTGAISEVCNDAGWLVPEGSAEALAQALRELHANKAEWLRLRQAGLDRVRRHYTWQRVADELWSLYQECMRLH